MSPFTPDDQYNKIPCVVYYRLEPKQKAIRVNYVCFGGMISAGIPSAIRYIAPINMKQVDGSAVAEGAHDFYLKFMKQVLTRPESPKFLFKKIKDNIHFKLETKGLYYYRALLFLTWFRYVHQYPEVIHRLFVGHEAGDSLEDTFKKFQVIHNDAANGKFFVSSKAWTNEMVMYNYPATDKTITLDKLWSNMATQQERKASVQSCFK